MAKRQHSCISSPGLFESLCMDALICVVAQLDIADTPLILSLLGTARAWLPLLKRRLDEWLRRALISDAVIASESLVAIQRFTKNCLERRTFQTARHYSLATGALGRIAEEYGHLGRAKRLTEMDENYLRGMKAKCLFYYDGTRHPVNICHLLGVQSCKLPFEAGYFGRGESFRDQLRKAESWMERCAFIFEHIPGVYLIPVEKNHYLHKLVYLDHHLFSKECDAFRRHCYVCAEAIRNDPERIRCAISATDNHTLLHQSIDQKISQYTLLSY